MGSRVLVAAISFLVLCHAGDCGASSAAVGSAAPDFTLNDINGSKVSLSSFRGKTVLLNFWATFCRPCREEMAGLDKLYRELKDMGLVVIAVSIDKSDGPVKAFAQKQDLSFPMLIDKDKEVYFDTYALYGLPVSILIDRKGAIIEKTIGEAAWDAPMVKERIRRFLGGQQ